LKRPVTTVIVTHALDWTGAPLCQLELATALRDRGAAAPRVISPTDGPLRRRYESAGIPVSISPALSAVFSVQEYQHVLGILTAEWRGQKPGAVWANTLNTFYAVDAAERLGIGTIWSVRESEPWATYYSHLSEPVQAVALGCFSKPYRVVFGSNATMGLFDALNSRHNFCVAYDGLLLDGWRDSESTDTRAAARQQLGVAPDDIVVVAVGTVCERKGQHDLVQALARMDRHAIERVRCWIVGDRPSEYSRVLHELIATLVPTIRARITVVDETEDVRTYYRAADVYVCTSRRESYPRVTLQAMASGLPIISTPVFGISEQLVENVNGVFYEPGNAGALAAGLGRLIQDPGRRAELARQSSAVFAGLKRFDETVDDYEVFLREAAEL
jgi:glycosyltransferase involved in cell wall biosynthesis